MTEIFTCPDCRTEWDLKHEPRCLGCSLSWEDIEASADFLDDLEQVRR